MPRSKLATGIVFGLPIGITLYLGTWQTQRYFWKVNLIERHERKMKEKPVSLEQLPAFKDLNASEKQFEEELAEYEFTKIRTEGVFDHNNEQLLGLRKPPEEDFPTTDSKKFGYYLITPLKTKEGQTLLVNRGWVPREGLDRAKRPIGSCALCGVIRKPEKKPSLYSQRHALSKDGENQFWVWLNSNNILRHLGIHQNNTLIIDQVPCNTNNEPSFMRSETDYPRIKSQSDHGFPITPEKHAGYAVTWFGLASALSLITIRTFVKRLR